MINEIVNKEDEDERCIISIALSLSAGGLKIYRPIMNIEQDSVSYQSTLLTNSCCIIYHVFNYL